MALEQQPAQPLDVLVVAVLEVDHLAVDVGTEVTASGSHTKATPPDMPAPKLRPVRPSTTTRPPVMYSQPWSPTPSTTATAPELRTAKRSPTTPRMKASPAVAPYRITLPAMICSSATKDAGADSEGRTTSRPPDRPLPR